jgi:hypothetical protein
MTARFPVSGDNGARHARIALESYRRSAADAGASTEALLRSLILDLGHFAVLEGIPFMPIIAHAQACWLQESAKAKERPKRPSHKPTPADCAVLP